MEKRSYSDPDLTSENQTRKNLKSARLKKINQSLRLKGEINFQLNDTFTFDPQKYIGNAKLELIDNEADDEIPPPYTSLSDGIQIKKFKSETDLKSIEISVISFEKLKIQHKTRKKRPNLQAKQGYGSIVERLIGGIFSISCLFPKKINFSTHHQQNIAHEDLELKDFLGRGAQGSVYRAVFKNEEVAVKIVESKEDADVQHLMKLDHKNLVKFKGTAINGEKKFFGIVMEFCPKKSLYEFLNHQILLEPSKIIEMAKQITEGMSYLHEKKIIHRDLKSPNILLAENNVLKITDFGACKDISDEGTEKSFKGTDETTNTINTRALVSNITFKITEEKNDYYLFFVYLTKSIESDAFIFISSDIFSIFITFPEPFSLPFSLDLFHYFYGIV
ncbi:mitogen-activated kinase kinase kinase 12-like [Brachionus plicatilis]|uniref:Mitogen-activated kinase kinase kinase 12-like n=1 Tax=Brachionus plicatilis TaxID=10195 RepID=A0A3M7SCA9_BRAPC|nr:mitogen-activated kinase kinase kinase 12-like [Brachionus plicatilis]